MHLCLRRQAEQEWPEPKLEERQELNDQPEAVESRFGGTPRSKFSASQVVNTLIDNEETLNEALDFGELDYSGQDEFKSLKYRLQVELTCKEITGRYVLESSECAGWPFLHWQPKSHALLCSPSSSFGFFS